VKTIIVEIGWWNIIVAGEEVAALVPVDQSHAGRTWKLELNWVSKNRLGHRSNGLAYQRIDD